MIEKQLKISKQLVNAEFGIANLDKKLNSWQQIVVKNIDVGILSKFWPI